MDQQIDTTPARAEAAQLSCVDPQSISMSRSLVIWLDALLFVRPSNLSPSLSLNPAQCHLET